MFSLLYYFRPEISIFLSRTNQIFAEESSPTTETIADCKLKEAERPI
jgi:hypothetical protein